MPPAGPSASRVTAVPSQATMVEQSMASSSSIPRMDPSPVAEQVLLVQPSSAGAQSLPATMTVLPIQQQQQLPHSGALAVEAVQQQQQMAAMQQVMSSTMRTATLLPSQPATAPMLQQVVAQPQQQVVNVIPAGGLQTVMTTDTLPAGSLQAVPVNLQTVSAGGVVTTQQVHLIQQSSTPPDLQQAVAPGQTVVVHTPPDVAQLSHNGGRQLQHSSSAVSQKQIAMKQAAIQQHVRCWCTVTLPALLPP